MNNLFISYDLNSPGQDYTKIHEKIMSLGNWAKIQKSFWYVNSSHSAEQAKDALLSVIDSNDSIIVVDATNKSSSWYGVSDTVGKHIIDQWNI